MLFLAPLGPDMDLNNQESSEINDADWIREMETRTTESCMESGEA